MKQELIDIISSQNKLMNGGLINQPVEEYVEKILNKASLLIYMIHGTIAGFVAYYCNDPLKQRAFLTMLCIAPENTGKGIGSYLLNCSIADIKSKGFIIYELDVKENNTAAIQLYKNAGFEIAGFTNSQLKMKKEIISEA